MDSHTMIQALIYLGAAALIVPVAVRLGLGSVLGYLIAGCVIGPWGFRLVTDAESILHFAGDGVESRRADWHDAGALLDGDCHAGNERT